VHILTVEWNTDGKSLGLTNKKEKKKGKRKKKKEKRKKKKEKRKKKTKQKPSRFFEPERLFHFFSPRRLGARYGMIILVMW
jgi:hypothetical protein